MAHAGVQLATASPGVGRQEGQESGYQELLPEVPGVEARECAVFGEVDRVDSRLDIVSRKINRFGTESRKLISKARHLGFHPEEYVPGDRKGGTSSTMNSFWGSTSTSDYRSQPGDVEAPPGEFRAGVDALEESGLDLEEITHFVYNHLQDQALPNFGKFLLLDEDGGLDRVHMLWNNQRIVWAIVLFGSVIMNVLYILQSNWVVFQGFSSHVMAANPQDIDDIAKTIEDMGQGSDENGIFGNIQDSHRRGLILQMAGIVGTVEVVWMALRVLRAILQCARYVCAVDEYRQYRAGLHFFRESLPALSTFSVLKSVAFVHPSLLASSYYEMLQERQCGCFKKCCSSRVAEGFQTLLVTLFFVLTRMLVGAMAVAAFAMKLTAVGLKLTNPKYKFMGCFVSTALLMNQCMGAVMIEHLLQDRIFLFIFGGMDTDFRPDELALKGVYQCRLAKQIWEHYYVNAPRFSGWKAIVVMATLDHFDLQMLLINDEDEKSIKKEQKKYEDEEQK